MDRKSLLKDLVFIRRRIHQYPELGNDEFKTAELIEKVLKNLKIPCKRLGPTGVVGVLKGGEGPCVALRADMDALPLTEKNSNPYRSKNPGIMHACGHDSHVAMLLGAARLLSQKKLPGTVKFFFQPNEEGAGGAKDLITLGAMKNPKVDATFGLHVNPRFRTGTVALKPGPLMAAVDRFTLEVIGQGGHAAYPHEGKDAVLIAAELIQALQSVVSRKIDPTESAVLTVGTINAGTRYNILAEKAVLTGTVRTLSEAAQKKIPQFIRQISDGVTRAHGATYRLEYETIGSVLSNSKSMVDLSRQVAARLFGDKRVLNLDSASMGGEDFSEYLKISPGCFIYIGCGKPGMDKPWHHPEFDLDEEAMPTGSELLAGITEEYLGNPQ